MTSPTLRMSRDIRLSLGFPLAVSLAAALGVSLAVPAGLAAQDVPGTGADQDTVSDTQDGQAGGGAGDAVVAGVSTEDYNHAEAPRAIGVRLEGGSISLDGILDEAAWTNAPPITDFIQIVPFEGRPGSERTEVRILYDDEAIYVGADLGDSQPVSTQLVRRDGGLSASDAFEILFDSYHEHETAYRFGTNPSAIRSDAVISSGGGGFGGRGGGGGDSSWDPVWDVATEITDRGWSLEMRIPFSQLRFQPTVEQTWGIQVERTIQRNQERVLYPFVPSLERGGISRYGHLDGLGDLETGRRLELLPYLTARGEYLQLSDPDGVGFDNPYRSGSDLFGDVGLDFKYRLGMNLTLDATVNPDFGQVEVDPSVINLTAFETRYQERRPFFVEGADIFQFGEGGPRGSVGNPPALLYSRRIGRPPHGSAPSHAVFEDAPGSTTIYQAGKISGRVGEGWSLGLLEAVTAEETAAYVDDDGNPGEVAGSPFPATWRGASGSSSARATRALASSPLP